MTTETKYFTPDEAKKTLPLVKKIVQDILIAGQEIRLLADDLNGQIQDHPEVNKLLGQIDRYMVELEEIGCFYKDWNFSIGLVDFPAIIDGKEVLLCWRSDEDEIRYYHEIDNGYAGRRLIPAQYFSK